MKKIVAGCVIALLAFQVAVAKEIVTKDVNKLPVAAREVIKKNFSKEKISYIKIDKDMFQSVTYEATLSNGTEIDFNSKGEWVEINSKKESIPTALIPANIGQYIKSNFVGQQVKQIERGRKGYEVELSNGLDVKFDTFGGFLKLSN